jgi:hypothetical protein
MNPQLQNIANIYKVGSLSITGLTDIYTGRVQKGRPDPRLEHRRPAAAGRSVGGARELHPRPQRAAAGRPDRPLADDGRLQQLTDQTAGCSATRRARGCARNLYRPADAAENNAMNNTRTRSPASRPRRASSRWASSRRPEQRHADRPGHDHLEDAGADPAGHGNLLNKQRAADVEGELGQTVVGALGDADTNRLTRSRRHAENGPASGQSALTG